ncbi:aldo/keto reductase [Lichenihabitans psoromatis]|uniref:aldo/keto reductase n=1 Tax=Lichenihabitans psoromatis TaxID=2528642 RepID=UPI00315CD5C7
MKILDSKAFLTRAGKSLAFTSLGLGGAPLGDLFERLDQQTAHDTILTAYRSGIRVFDTSPHYGNGLSEARFGAALRDLPRDAFLLSTKVGRRMDPFTQPAPARADVTSPGFAGGFPHRAMFDYSYDGTMRSIEQSLLRTGLSRFDILMIHDCDVWTQGADMIDQRFKEAMDGAYKALDRLRSEGTVAAIGVGVNEADICERFARAGDFDVMMLAGRYSLLEQPALASFLPLAEQKSIGILLAGVFNSGILATGAVPGATYNYTAASTDIMTRVGRIEAVCQRHGVTLRQAALGFALHHPAVVTLVLGAVKPGEMEANVADAQIAIPPALWSELKREGLLDAAAPTG